MDENGTGIPPDDEPVEAAPETQEPPRPTTPPIPSFVKWRERVNADNAAGSPIGSVVKEWFDAQNQEEQERIGMDVDALNAVWDRVEAAFPPRPAPPPPIEPAPPREYHAPAWQVAQWEREARRTTQRFDSLTALPPSVAEQEGAGDRREAAKQNKEINALRERVRGGDKDAEFELASKLFGNAAGWKPGHGPEHG